MIRLRTHLQQRRRSLIVLGALALVCFAVTWAHGAPAGHEMGADGNQMAQAISICLAVVQAASWLLVAVAAIVVTRRRRGATSILPTAGFQVFARAFRSTSWPRAGPAALQVFLR